MDLKPRFSRSCPECKTPNDGEFKKILDLQNSGLVVYIHKEENSPDERKISERKNEYYILHNTNHKDLKRPDFINELCQYKTRCYRCRTIVQKVRNLLDEISAIRRNDVLGVCTYCKKVNPAGKCRRCEFIIEKFRNNKAKQNEDRQTKVNTWLSRVREFLESFLEEEKSCRHRSHRESSVTELQNLLEELKLPLTMREPDIELFTTADSQVVISQSKEMLEELLSKLKLRGEESFMSGFHMSPSASQSTCVCKHLRDNKFLVLPPLTETQEIVDTMPIQESDKDIKEGIKIGLSEKKSDERKRDFAGSKSRLKENVKIAAKDGALLKKSTSKEKGKASKENKPPKEPKEPKEPKPRKKSLSPEEKLMLKMMKQREQQKKQTEKPAKKEKSMVLPKFEELPPLKVHEVVVIEESSESILECRDQKAARPVEMVKGSKIVKFAPRANEDDLSVEPMLFKTQPVCPEPVTEPPPPATTPIRNPSTDNTQKKQKQKDTGLQVEINTKGLINYELSNRDFIDKGWTQLPTTKIMRRMNIYKMVPANPKYDWFKINKLKGIKFYDTGETLAEIDMDGCGRWYYKNGGIALDYYNAEELNAGQRYVVYSSGEEMDSGKLKPYTVLASFDYLGNGVVYDQCGNMRLKYNQSEGVVIDSKIGPPGRWKWHTLNDPPILQPAFIDTRERHPSPHIQELIKTQKDNIVPPRDIDQNMLSIELDNFLKEKARKLLQKYKPFQIRTKVLKLNDKFSLRILDQANIYLLFRDGPTSLKLNLGMLLLNNEIIDTDTTEVSEVATPYDRRPPRTHSVADIQSKVDRAKKMSKTRGIRL
ncbi:hypothetical protein O3G_MSEX003480 [Manduca sexta]|uniref:FAM194 C-terminal domain-containing protein n=2 Tax=Manduca sexta TaxID=7130 RepID=A0A921YS45_MANSE|nr:hypothetical protein O3G_MSEX003480 [Manduca sexta]